MFIDVGVKTVRFGSSGAWEFKLVEQPSVDLLYPDKLDFELVGMNTLLVLIGPWGLYSFFVLKFFGCDEIGEGKFFELSRLFRVMECEGPASGNDDTGYNVLDVTECRWLGCVVALNAALLTDAA